MSQSRRDLLRTGAALAAAGAVPSLLRGGEALAQAGGDAALLEAAIRLEQESAAAYAARSGPVARLFAQQNEEHAAALARALRRLGGSPPRENDRLVEDTLDALLELEATTVSAYHETVGKLQSPDLLPTLASIMANHAQHLAVLRQALGRNPAPDAFVGEAGRSRP